MPIRVAIPKEILPREHRVSLIPDVARRLAKLDIEVLVESGAGNAAHYPDADYDTARIVSDPDSLYGEADIVLAVQPPSLDAIDRMREGTILIGLLLPFQRLEHIERLKERNITSFSMELVPRISRAQSMDVLSSQAAVAGYKAVLLAATRLGKMFPMMMTAAGSIQPAKVFVLGAGVAGLQAIATAKRLGAVVEAYDIRPEVKDQVKSVGGRFVELEIETTEAGDSGGYANEQSEDFYAKQQELMTSHVRSADIVIAEPTMSRSHAAIGFDGDDFFVQDLGSTNGTRVNGSREEKSALKRGDEIQLGKLRVQLELPD